MKKFAVTLALATALVTIGVAAYSKAINETDTELCERLKYALINSLREPIDQAIT